ncbi:MAG: hypothetical protein HOH33_12770 [Verrucomicrobia bacterium]|jgi:hypothetical protein|nr:hypothetical protein [Verrucomicrobiota bacterium]
MNPLTKKKTPNLLIGIIITLICVTGFVLVHQTKGIDAPSRNRNLKTDLRNGLPKTPTGILKTVNKANLFLNTIRESLKQPRDFPFQPEWSSEVYNPTKEVTNEYQERLKRHALLRNFYTSEARFSSEFYQLHELLEAWNFDDDPIIRIVLFDTIQASSMKRESLEVDQNLLHPFMKEKLEKLIADDKKYINDLFTNTYKIDDPKFLESLMLIRPNVGFGAPDTHIEPNEPLLVR